MRRKPQTPVTTLTPAVLETPPEAERPKTMAKCEVCGAEANPNPVEQLCWVCRRLKISAWRDVEQSAPTQE